MSRLSRGGRSNSVGVSGDVYERDWARTGGVPESVLGTMDVLIDETVVGVGDGWEAERDGAEGKVGDPRSLPVAHRRGE